jgi:hypothetical protein
MKKTYWDYIRIILLALLFATAIYLGVKNPTKLDTCNSPSVDCM